MNQINLSILTAFTRRGTFASFSVIKCVLMEISNWPMRLGGSFLW